MKILFLNDDFPPFAYGGSAIVTYRLAKKFQELGHEVVVITTVQKRERVNIKDDDKFRVIRLFSNYHLRFRAWVSLYNFWLVKDVKKIIIDFNPDVVHCHNIHFYLSYVILKIAKNLGKPVFLTVHDWMPICYGKLMPKLKENSDYLDKSNLKVSFFDSLRRNKLRFNPFRNLIIRYYLSYVDKIFCISHEAEIVLSSNGIKNMVVIYNGIDLPKMPVEENKFEAIKKRYNLSDKKVIFFAGRLSELKGGRVILNALVEIKAKIPNVCLLVAGQKNNYGGEMIKIAKELGVSDNLIITGWLSLDEIAAIYPMIDVCVVPSIYIEPFGLINIEAMAFGKPVVVSSFGAGKEIVVDGITGYVVNPLNITLLANRIMELLNDSAKAVEFGQAGFKRVKEKFSLDLQVQKTIFWYNKFIS